MEIRVSSCTWSIIIGIVLLVFLVLVCILSGTVSLRSTYQQLITGYCKQTEYYPYVGNLPTVTPGVYQHDLAMFLMINAFNVSVSNCGGDVGNPPLPPGFTESERIVGVDPLHPGQQRMFAYMYHSSTLKTTIISLTGTIFIDEWVDDLYYPQVMPYQLSNYIPGQNMLVHGGFYGIYSGIQARLWELWNTKYKSVSTQLLITGHSLGAALATMCGFDFGGTVSGVDTYVYTFAAPRSGNTEYASAFDAINPDSYRIFNTEDIVPALPPPIWLEYVYTHAGKNISFTENLGAIDKNHTDAYKNFLP